MRRILLILFFFCGLSVSAQVTFDVRTPLAVTSGERFQVEFVLANSEGSGFVAPTMSGLDILAGPTMSRGTQITIINGAQKSSTSESYIYIVKAQAVSKATIGVASITAQGRSYSTKALSIEVMSGSGTGSSGAGKQAPTGDLATDDILLRMEVNKSSVYKGDAVVATLKLYTRVGIAGLEDAKYAAFNGFWAQELTVPRSQGVRATIADKVYQAVTVRQWLLYPQRSGLLEIERTDFTAVAQIATNSGGLSLFDQFFGGGTSVETVRRKITAPPVKVNVLELPAPVPAGFTGAVGRFTMQSNLSASQIPANQGGSIIIKLSGNGDFPLLETPKITLPAAFEQYDTKTTDQITNSTSGASGTRTLEFPFIARAEGTYDIPAVEITYFDPALKSYKTLSSGDFKIEVTKSTGTSAVAPGAMISGVTKEDLKMLGQDIRFIKVGDPELRTKDDKVLWGATFFIILGLEIAAFVVLLYLLRRIIARRQNVVLTKNKRANKVAIKRLRRAKGFMASKERERFFEEILRALWGYMGDKLAIEVSGLTKERVAAELAIRGVSEQQQQSFLELIGECEFAQYSPAADTSMEQAYEQALDMIGNLEIKN